MDVIYGGRLVQGLIVCLGDIVLLKVQCVHPVAFVCVGIFCSFIYVNLIYALALTFKHIGKALGVVLVILQIRDRQEHIRSR